MARYPTPVQPGDMAPYGALSVPRFTPELIGLIKTGTVYSLAVPLYEGIGRHPAIPPYSLKTAIRHGDAPEIAPVSGSIEIVTACPHTGTHIDALCHIGEWQDSEGNVAPPDRGEVRLYDGPGRTVSARAKTTPDGMTHLSIAEMPPIVTRGVLLDVAGYLGVEVLPDCYTISVDDICGTLARQGTEVKPGTAALIRTGCYKHLRDGNPAFAHAIAGIGLPAAKLLASQGMILIGADNGTVEPQPPPDHDVHRFDLVHNGITHIEVLYLEELAEKQVYEFVLIVTPLRLQGSTGSWVHPIAIA